MIDETEAARARLEKTRLDPPPDGKEWSLGWTDDGRRDPARDMLVTIEQPAGADLGLSFGDAVPGYVYPVGIRQPDGDAGRVGPGVRGDLVSAAMFRLASLYGVTDPAQVDQAAERALMAGWHPDGGELVGTDNLLTLAIGAALEQLYAERRP